MVSSLITGAPGWIGSRLVQALQADPASPRLRCLVLPEVPAAALPAGDGVEVVRGDLRDPAATQAFCRGAEGATLFHCAGLIHPARFTRDLDAVNVAGTRHLLTAAEAAGVRRAVVLSSNSPLGVNPSREHRFDEQSPYHPSMTYGRSKMLMEQATHEVQARGRLETVILRPMWFYGPGQPERQTTFFRMIRRGGAPIIGDGGNLRSLTYVDSLCQALRLAGRQPAANGQTYWIADERPYSMNEIIGTVERLMETEFGLTVAHRRLRLPVLASAVAGWCDAGLQSLGLYHQKIHVLSEMDKTIACSIDKARRELGYAPEVELEEGLRRSLAWCVAQGIAL